MVIWNEIYIPSHEPWNIYGDHASMYARQELNIHVLSAGNSSRGDILSLHPCPAAFVPGTRSSVYNISRVIPNGIYSEHAGLPCLGQGTTRALSRSDSFDGPAAHFV
jgi:hypothetical protein